MKSELILQFIPDLRVGYVALDTASSAPALPVVPPEINPIQIPYMDFGKLLRPKVGGTAQCLEHKRYQYWRKVMKKQCKSRKG
jgi:hypothetical protein